MIFKRWFLFSFKTFWTKQQKEKEAQAKKAEKILRKERETLEKDRERLEMAAGSIDDLFTEAEWVIKSKISREIEAKNSDSSEDEGLNNEQLNEEEEATEALQMRTEGDEEEEEKRKKKLVEEVKRKEEEKKKKKSASIDPEKFVQKVNLSLPTMQGKLEDQEEDGESGGEDFDEERQADAIREAFAGDDVVADFK